MALEAVVKLTKEQYEILANGGTVGPYTGIDNTKYLYFIQDDSTPITEVKVLKTDNTTAQTTSASESIAGSGTINLHKVSKTGSYDDLNDKPTIPTVNNGKLSIQGNGTTASEFTANQSGNTTLNIKGSGGTTVSRTAANEITVSSTSVGNGTLTIQKNGTSVATFTANQSGNATANITVPTSLDDVPDGSTRKLANYQAKDADLTAIASLTGTGFLKRTATDTWELQNSPQILDDDAVIFKQSSGQHEDVRLSRKTIGGTSTTAADYNLLKLISADDGSNIKTGITFWNYIITADTTTNDTNYRYFKLPTKNAGTYTLATTSDIPTVTNYYWADVKVASSSNKGTTPTVSTITIGGSGSTAGKATMQYNSTEDCIEFVFA